MVGGAGEHACEDGVADKGVLIPLMGLVGEGIGEEGQVHVVAVYILALVGDALDPAEEGVQAGVVPVEEALHGVGSVALDQDLGANRQAGEVRGAVAVEDVVAVVNVAGVGEGLLRVDDGTQAVHAAGGGNAQGDQLFVHGLHGGAGVANVGGTRLNRSQTGAVQGGGADDHVCLGGVAGGAEVHQIHGHPVVVIGLGGDAVGVHVAHSAGGEGLGGATDVHGGSLFDDVGGDVVPTDAGGGEHIGILHGEVILVGADEVPFIGALGDHAHHLAGLQQGVHGGHGILGGVGNNHVPVGLAGKLGLGVGVQIGLGSGVVQGGAHGGGDGLVGGRLRAGDHVEAAGVVEGGDAFGVQLVPVADHGALVENAVGHRTLGLVHGNHHGAGGIGDAVIGHGLVGDAHLHVVAGEPLDHVIGGLEVGLVGVVQGDQVALGEELAVLALAVVGGAEEVGLSAQGVGGIHQPGTYLRVGVLVGKAPGVDFHLVGEVAVLVAGHIVRQAQQAVGGSGDGAVAVGGQLHGVGDAALKHGKLGGVAGGHVVPGLRPVGIAVFVAGQVVTHGDHIALVVVVIGNGSCAEGLAAGHQVVGQQVVFHVGLMGRGTGLHLEAGDLAVELQQGHGVVGGNQVLHVLGLYLGLEGVVPVQVIAAGGVAGDVHPALHVLLGNQNEEHVVQQVVHLHGGSLAGVIFVKAGNLAGILGALSNAGLRQNRAQEVGLVLHQLGQVQTQGVPLGVQDFLAGFGEAQELFIADGVLLHQHLGEGHDAVHGGHFVGVDVGVENGDLIVQLVRLDISQDPFRVGLCPVAQLQPVVHGVAVLGNDEIGHVVAGGGGAHALLHHIGLGGLVVVVAQGGQAVQLGVDLPHSVEVLIGLHQNVALAGNLLALHRGYQVEGAAHVQIGAAAGVGGAGVTTAHHGVGGEGQGHGAAAEAGLQTGDVEEGGVVLGNRT